MAIKYTNKVEIDSVSTAVCRPHKEERCEKVEYKLCEKADRKVPVKLVRKLYVPKFGKCAKVILDKDGKCAKLCTEVEGWKLCAVDEHVVDGLLTEKIYGPHFHEARSCDKKRVARRHHEEEDEEEDY